MLGVALGYAVSIALRLVYGTGLAAHPWAVTLVSSLLLVTAAALALAFFPPAAYRRRMERTS